MSTSINFTVGTDKAIKRVMEAFLSATNRLIVGPLTVEELLVHVVRQPEVHIALVDTQVNFDDLEKDAIAGLMEAHEHGMPEDETLSEQEGEWPPCTAGFEQVVIQAIHAVQSRGESRDANLVDLLWAIASFPADSSIASAVLHEHGLSQKRLQAIIRQRHATPLITAPAMEPTVRSPALPGLPLREDPATYDLTRRAHTWVDRQDLVEHALRVLSCQRGPGLLLVGPAGVGKSCLAAEIAKRLGQTTGLPMVGLDIQVLLANSQVRGDLERQVMTKTQALEKAHPQGLLLWLHNVGDLLMCRRQGQDLIAPLRAVLRRGVIRLVASATPEQAKQLGDADSTLIQHFTTLRVQPPTAADVAKVVHLALPRYQTHHKVTYAEGLVENSIELLARHKPKGGLLSSALSTLDEAGALVARLAATDRVVSQPHVEEVVARQFALSREWVGQSWGARLDQVETHLRDAVRGQSHVIDSMLMTLRLAHAGLSAGGQTRPLGSFFFAGPTGVGKTETATQLAQGLGVPLLRLDMSEYAESHSVSRLIGAPPGYVGHQEGGHQLVTPLTQNPRMVVLLDEFEKAHAQVHALFLQVMDKGVITDGQGTSVDCRQAIFIFTSNVGAQEAAQAAIGFTADTHEGEHRRDDALKRLFTPEFRNRFDHILQFHALSAEDVRGVVDRMLRTLSQRVADKGHTVRFSASLKKWLAQAGHDPAMGARPLQRLVDKEVAYAMAKLLLSQSAPATLSLTHRKGQVHAALV